MSSAPGAPVVEADGLVKRYAGETAVDDVSFAVERGTVLGLLGPNGAGKTTTVRMMTTMTRPDRGTALVAGYDVVRDPHAVRASMGLVGQAATVDELLTCRENLWMIGSLQGLGGRELARRTDELVERFGLDGATDKRAGDLSGGMRRRLDLALSLIARPQVLFLDEPTTGLDPRSRAELWAALRDMVSAGMTMVLTTQYLEEADQLADHLVVIDHGRVVAQGSPSSLKERAGSARLVLTVTRPEDLDPAAQLMRDRVGPVEVERFSRSLVMAGAELADVVRVGDLFVHSEIELDSLGLQRPSLDDVFLDLTAPGASTSAPTDSDERQEVAS